MATIFRGQPGVDTLPSEALGKMTVQPRISGGGHYRGLLDYGIEKSPVSVGNIESGPEIFSGVVQAVSQLESCGYFGPYACVLGNKMFEAVNKPLKDSMVLPRDSILPYLNGPLLRSSTLPEECGVLVSLLGDPVEIVVGSDIAARYLQTTAEAKHVFRVSQRFVLRVKEPQAIAALMP